MTAEDQRRLSFHDALFLHWEHSDQPMHVGECMVYDGRFSREEIVQLLAARLHLLPRYRQRIVPVPLSLSYPTWEDDPQFALDRHVDELTLPTPGNDLVLSHAGGKLFSERLDRRHPLWKLTLVKGHSSGNSILVLRLHHAMVDGVSAVALVDVLHSLDPAGSGTPREAEPWEPRSLPSTPRVVADAVTERLRSGVGAVRGAGGLLRPADAVREVREAAALLRTVWRGLPLFLRPPRQAPFNRSISAERQFAWLELPFRDVRAVRRSLGGTVNDMVLTVLAGALGRYMRRHDESIDGLQLRAMVPVSMRRPGHQGPMGNAVSMVVVPLHVGVQDPIERLRLEREAMDRAKAEEQAVGIYRMIQLSRRVPPPVHALALRLAPTSARMPFNIVSTNVPGPQRPMYLAGRELLHWYPLGVPWTNLGLFLCTLSYNKTLTLGLVADPTIVPDLWDVVEDLRAAYQELRVAAGYRSSEPRKGRPTTMSSERSSRERGR